MSRNVEEGAVLEFAFEVKSLVAELNTVLAALFRPLGLTSVQAEALVALDALGPSTLRQLSEHLVAESGHPSRLVSRLVDSDLVTRTASTTDGRAVVLTLTQRGRSLAEEARQVRAPLLTEFARQYGTRLEASTSLVRDLRAALLQS